MKKNRYSRRDFIKDNSLAGLGAAAALGLPSSLWAQPAGGTGAKSPC